MNTPEFLQIPLKLPISDSGAVRNDFPTAKPYCLKLNASFKKMSLFLFLRQMHERELMY